MIAALGRAGGSYAAVLREPRYARLWLAGLVSSFGDTLHYIALVVLVFQLSGQGLAVAGLVAIEILPVLLLAPIAGVLIDRTGRAAILIGSDLFRAALALTLVWPQGVWHAYVVAAGLSIGTVFFNPTHSAVIPAVTTAEQRLAANSVSWSTGRLVQILAAAAAGGAIALVGTGPAFALNAVSFALSAALIATIRIPPHAGQLGGATRRGLGAFFNEAREGLAYARRDRFVSRLLLVQSLASFAVGATGAMLVVLAERRLDLPAAGFAWLIGAIGLGALVGPIIPNAFARDHRSARWLFVPYVIRGIGDILIAVFTPLPVALALLFVYGVCTSTGMVVFSSTIQGAIPDRFRGRVFTLLDVSWSAMRLLSLGLGGLLVDRLGIAPLYWIGGTLLTFAGLLGLTLFRRTRFADGPNEAGAAG